MKKRISILMVFAISICPSIVLAGPERIDWPENYASHFVRYHSVDKPKGDKPAKIRYMYVDKNTLSNSIPGEPLPDGAMLIMEDRSVVLDANGNPKKDKKGRYIATDDITAVIIQQKKSGWGASYSEALRNGDWEYAVFDKSGNLKKGVEYDKCFMCHKGQAQADYNFTFTPFLSRIKPQIRQ